jgi:pimeloyl-ACP methyl ester carboxylesterase
MCILGFSQILDIAKADAIDSVSSGERMPTTLVNGIKLYYEVHGQDKPLILIQGLGGRHQAWFFQVRAFKKHFQVVTIDNRGIGKSSQISREPYTIKVMADDVIGLMDHLSIDKAHILGLSLGGMVAQEIAISYPHRVDKLILCSTFASREEHDDTPDVIRNVLEVESSGVDSMSLDWREFISSFISLSFNKRPYRMFFNLLSRFGIKSTHIQGYLGQIGAVRDYETKSRLHLIHSPTLVITGTEDKLVASRFSEMIASRIPHARLVEVSGGSHAFFIEMSDRFNREILDFLIGR